jgi:hypothetical protein
LELNTSGPHCEEGAEYEGEFEFEHDWGTRKIRNEPNEF